MSGSSTRNFSYDNAGNMVSDDRAGGLYELAYDPAGRLSAVDLDGLPESEYRYNALGERAAKQPPGNAEFRSVDITGSVEVSDHSLPRIRDTSGNRQRLGERKFLGRSGLGPELHW